MVQELRVALRTYQFKLYCTVSALTPNSQGLSLRLDRDDSLLHENSDKPEYGDFVQWRLPVLHKRLLEKHNETFWITADSSMEDGFEYLHYTRVEHTRKPILSQFDLLLEQGIITMDHLIKRNSKGKMRWSGKSGQAKVGTLPNHEHQEELP